jgi:hypothetical protein
MLAVAQVEVLTPLLFQAWHPYSRMGLARTNSIGVPLCYFLRCAKWHPIRPGAIAIRAMNIDLAFCVFVSFFNHSRAFVRHSLPDHST